MLKSEEIKLYSGVAPDALVNMLPYDWFLERSMSTEAGVGPLQSERDINGFR